MASLRINRYIAHATGMSRRAADQVIADDRVRVNDNPVAQGAIIDDTDIVTIDDKPLELPKTLQTILINKPAGYVVSRDGQGSPTIYTLLPPEFHSLKPVGRLDKDSSGLLLLTDDGALAQSLTHPSKRKKKAYVITLDKDLSTPDRQAITDGVLLDDGPSRLALKGQGNRWIVTMYEGRNRQIRRTFARLGYTVTDLHRIRFGDFALSSKLQPGDFVLL